MRLWPFTQKVKVRRPTAAEVDASLEPYRRSRTLNAELHRRAMMTTDLLRRSGAVSAIKPTAGWR